MSKLNRAWERRRPAGRNQFITELAKSRRARTGFKLPPLRRVLNSTGTCNHPVRRTKKAMSNQTKWNIEADFVQACNCDYGCPCEFSAPPTKGFCEGMGAWHITRGAYGNVKLDGLGVGFAARWPKAIHEGN